MPKLRFPNDKEIRFRARPWPVVIGSQRDLDSKRVADCMGRPDIDHSDFEDLLMRVEREIDMRFLRTNSLLIKQGHGPLIGPCPLQFDLFAQQSWRAQVWSNCHLPVDEDKLVGTEADAAFADLKERWCEDGSLERDPCFAVRELMKWLMEEDLDCLEFLLRHGILHVDGDFFEECTQEWQWESGVGEAQSLLSFAAKDACAPAAVRLLLDHGADPNGLMAPRSFNGAYQPECGPAGLASADLDGAWGCYEVRKCEILTALAEAGGDMFEASDTYKYRIQHFRTEADLCSDLCNYEFERRSSDLRQCLETIVAVVGIVSFWRRAAAAPDSKAAKAAIYRAAIAAMAMTTDS